MPPALPFLTSSAVDPTSLPTSARSGPLADAPSWSLAACPLPLVRASTVAHPERAVARGDLTRVRRGVYAPAEQWRDAAPWDRYLARVHAVALLHPDVVFSHESAAALWGMGVVGDPGPVHVLLPPRARSRETAGLRTHTGDEMRDIVVVQGIALTSPGDTAVTLARHRHHAIGLVAADAALRIDAALTPARLAADNESRASSRGRNIARWAIERATPLAETPLESINRAVIEWLGFPDPELQHEFRGTDGIDRADFFWEGVGLVGEVDGEMKYDGRFGDPLTVLRRRAERDGRLRRGHVRSVAHWGWRESLAVDPVRTLLRGHGLREEHPSATAQLASLRRHLSPRRDRETTTAGREHG